MELKRLEPADLRPAFSCGDSDLDEFYAVDSIEGGNELISVTYAFVHEGRVAAFFSLSNDSILKEQMSGSERRRFFDLVPRPKQYRSMPSCKIGRLGVCQERREKTKGTGTYVLDFLKAWFTIGNKTGCRFLVVDAYNNEKTRHFYEKNGFQYLTSKDASEPTRIMYFDLKRFAPAQEGEEAEQSA